MAIIEKDRYGLSQPRGGKDQVNCVVSVDITGLNEQAARRPSQTNRLWPSRRELELNPIVGNARTIDHRVDTGQIRVDIPVEVCDRKLRPRSKQRSGRIPNPYNGRCAAVSSSRQPQVGKTEQENAHDAPGAFWTYPSHGFSLGPSHPQHLDTSSTI
ncbi:MAG: hypothetical protein ABSA57_05690 [Candidatus Acidiferrales bacterium]|jgi:hypothetical protein